MKKIIMSAGLLVFMLSIQEAKAQDPQKRRKVNYSKHPHWVAMMQDSSANYFETVKAFDEYWKKRPEPSEEEEREHGKEKEEKHKRTVIGRIFHSEEKEREESNEYAIQYKRFKTWRNEVLPYVQPDGRILSKEEMLEIWKTQR